MQPTAKRASHRHRHHEEGTGHSSPSLPEPPVSLGGEDLFSLFFRLAVQGMVGPGTNPVSFSLAISESTLFWHMACEKQSVRNTEYTERCSHVYRVHYVMSRDGLGRERKRNEDRGMVHAAFSCVGFGRRYYRCVLVMTDRGHGHKGSRGC